MQHVLLRLRHRQTARALNQWRAVVRESVMLQRHDTRTSLIKSSFTVREAQLREQLIIVQRRALAALVAARARCARHSAFSSWVHQHRLETAVRVATHTARVSAQRMLVVREQELLRSQRSAALHTCITRMMRGDLHHAFTTWRARTEHWRRATEAVRHVLVSQRVRAMSSAMRVWHEAVVVRSFVARAGVQPLRQRAEPFAASDLHTLCRVPCCQLRQVARGSEELDAADDVLDGLAMSWWLQQGEILRFRSSYSRV